MQYPFSFRPRRIIPWLFFVLFLLSIPQHGFAGAPKQRTKSPDWTPPPVPTTTPPSSAEARIALAPSSVGNRTQPPGQALTARADANTPILNFRIHPLYLASMLVQKETVFAVRGDLDFVLGGRVTLGPSVAYHLTSTQDSEGLTEASTPQYLEEQLLEVGLLSNIYLTGKTSSGGFVLRPHLYWIDPRGDKVDGEDNVQGMSSHRGGIRGGTEIVYQVILKSGLNFEIGGGFTYHLQPYRVQYTRSNGVGLSEPSSRFVPSITAGVGWQF